MGFEADKINKTEALGVARATDRGGLPIIPIRKRGFHRALKRNEAWAVMRDCMTKMVNSLESYLYTDICFYGDPYIYGIEKFINDEG